MSDGADLLALGVAAHRQGKLAEAVAAYQRLLVASPQHAEGLHLLGVALFQTGSFPDAVASIEAAARLRPGEASYLNSLGVALRAAGRRNEAIDAYRRAISLQEDFAEAYANLGNALYDAGDFPAASECLRKSVNLEPANADAQYSLGLAQQALGQLDAAAGSYRRAIDARPEFAQALNNLGNVLQSQGRLEEAVSCYERAVAIRPDFAAPHANRANALALLGRAEAAEASHREAIAHAPTDSSVHRAYSVFLWRRGRLVEARHYAAVAAQNGDKLSKALGVSQLATTDAYLSDYRRVKSLSDEALAACPRDQDIWAQRLYAFSYHPDLSAEEIFAEFVRWGDMREIVAPERYANSLEPERRLRIGFVSPDLKKHSISRFVEPLLANLDRQRYQCFAYAEVADSDEVSDRIRANVAAWICTVGVSDEELAARIRADKIDILVDLASHTRGNRLGVFALKPAPVQASWLGTAWTTGLPTIDYVLTDRHLAPLGTLARESIISLPDCFITYRPPESPGEVAAAPALRNGYITFGYTGRTERMNHRVFRAWRNILTALPSARLILDFKPFSDTKTCQYYESLLADHGIDVRRVTLRYSRNIFQGLQDIDILLDCFPHNAGTTLLDALWMGVPALTLASRPPVGRIGVSLMMNLGLPEWVTRSEEQYIERAVALAQDTGKLAEIRAGMRERMRQSPLMDEMGFTRGVENALRDMWSKWCADDTR